MTAAELCFAQFVAEHNLSFATGDHFTKVVKQMFPDSTIAGKFACGRTKTTALVTEALAPAADAPVLSALQSQKFTLLCDGGNNNFQKKYFAILVQFWDNQLDKVVTRFLDAFICNIANGQTLFDAMNASLLSRSIPWTNVVGFASDSASVMVGKRNSVLSRVRD